MLAHSVGLKTVASFIIGLPGKNKKSIEDSFNLWKEIKPYFTGFSAAIPFHGTEFESIVIKKGHLLINDYNKYSLDTFVVRTDDLTKEELEYYKERILNKVEIMEIKRKLRHIKANKKYFQEKIIDTFKDPRNIIKKFKTFYKLFKARNNYKK